MILLQAVLDHKAILYSSNGISVITLLGTFMGYMPQIAALLSAVWLGCQIYAWVFVKQGWRRYYGDDPNEDD